MLVSPPDEMRPGRAALCCGPYDHRVLAILVAGCGELPTTRPGPSPIV